jgi:hypothetical protein
VIVVVDVIRKDLHRLSIRDLPTWPMKNEKNTAVVIVADRHQKCKTRDLQLRPKWIVLQKYKTRDLHRLQRQTASIEMIWDLLQYHKIQGLQLQLKWTVLLKYKIQDLQQ